MISAYFGNSDLDFSNCYMICTTYNDSEVVHLPCYPDEISDNISSSWAEQTSIGRTVPMTTYVGTGFKKIGFSFDLHRDLVPADTTLEDIVHALNSTQYVKYTSYTVPITTFRFGEMVFKGIVNSVSKVWKKPLIENKYSLVTISIDMQCVPNSVPDASSIAGNSVYNMFND